jgi:hypothetical protein
MILARLDGQNVSNVIYDATRRPSISPRQVPTLDEAGLKIVFDAQGQRVMTKQGDPRQSADTAKGYVLQARSESPQEFGERLLKDMGERPDFYFGRREISRTDADLEGYLREVCQLAQQIRGRRRHNWWERNVGKWTCGRCSYSDFCLQGLPVDPEGPPPAGYKKLENVNPELGDLNDE